MNATKLVPWIAGALALIGAGTSLLPPAKVRGLDLDAFAKLPVLEGGRVKPVDSLARNSLSACLRSLMSFSSA